MQGLRGEGRVGEKERKKDKMKRGEQKGRRELERKREKIRGEERYGGRTIELKNECDRQ